MMRGLRALEAQGFEIMEGEELTEKLDRSKVQIKFWQCAAPRINAKPPSR